MGVLERNSLLVVEKVESTEFVKPEVDIGTELPPYSTAMGKMLLAHLPQAQLSDLVDRLELEARTSHTIVSRPDLKRHLQTIRKEGFAISDEEQFAGARSIAAPILDGRGVVRASIAVAGNITHPAWQEFPNLVATIQVAARDVSRNLRARALGRA